MDEVRMRDQIRALEHEMFGEARYTPLPHSDDGTSSQSAEENEQISVRVRVGDTPEEEIVDVDPSADVVETLRRELGIEGAACPPRPLASPDE